METPGPRKNGASTNGTRLVFDNYKIDPANRTVSRDGRELAVTGKDFDLLVFFARNPGRLLEKGELMTAVWPDSFVEEGNLAKHVSILRKLLDDTAKEHKYIATVQGKGYRFLAVVGADAAAETVQVPEAPAGASRSGHVKQRFWLVAVGTGVLAIGLIQSGSSLLLSKPFMFENIRQLKLTQDGDVFAPVISADGQYLAYICSTNGGGPGICVRQVSSRSVLQVVPGRKGLERWGPGIAPDNKFVYFISKDEGTDHGVLYRVPFLGGTPQKIAEKISGYCAAPDGSRLALTKRDVEAARTHLAIIHNDGSNERSLLTTELETAVYSLGWSPDGRNLLYSVRRQAAEGELRYVAEMPADGGAERRVPIASPARIYGIQWLPDGGGFLAIAMDDETRQKQLYHLSYPDGRLRRMTSDVAGVSYLSMTSDGRSIVTARTYDNRRIWVMPKGGTAEGLAVTSDTEKHFDSVEWADGGYLVFDQDENSSYGGRNIWRMRPDGSDRRQLTFGGGGNTQPTVSPDGRSIVFVSHRSGKSQLWRIDIEGGEAVQLTDLPENVAEPRFAHDGRHIFFDYWLNGMNQVWRVAPDGSGAVPVIEGADVRTWAVSPDGSRIVYSYFDRASGMVEARSRRVEGGDPGVPAGFMPESWMEWSRDGATVYFNTASDGAQNVWRKDMVSGSTTRVTAFTSERVFDCSWSSDGQRFACVRQLLTSDAVMIKY